MSKNEQYLIFIIIIFVFIWPRLHKPMIKDIKDEGYIVYVCIYIHIYKLSDSIKLTAFWLSVCHQLQHLLLLDVDPATKQLPLQPWVMFLLKLCVSRLDMVWQELMEACDHQLVVPVTLNGAQSQSDCHRHTLHNLQATQWLSFVLLRCMDYTVHTWKNKMVGISETVNPLFLR